MSLALTLSQVSKSYGATRALRGIDLEVQDGTVHAVLGENGAGKSTLVKILAGSIRPDAGRIEFAGASSGRSDDGGSQGGIATVFQELSLVPDLTVAENLFLKSPPRRFGLIDRRRLNKQAVPWLNLVGLADVSPRSPVTELSLTQRQLLEIAKALSTRPRLLILDEATASLPGPEVDRLFQILREEKRNGLTALYISHKMHEIDSIADHCTVLRNGAVVGTFPSGTKGHDEVCRMLVGKEITQAFPPKGSSIKPNPILRTRSLWAADKVRDVSLELRRGEILGIGGLEGHGQKELLLTLCGGIASSSGDIVFADRRVKPPSPASALRTDTKVLILPEERKSDGLLIEESIEENLVLTVAGDLSRFGLRNRSAEREAVSEMIKLLAIKANSPAQPVIRLSGGNQQKVLLGRLLLAQPSIFLLLDPTRGIDIGTKGEIYSILRKLVATGSAIALYTTDHLELVGLCDRVAVMYEGRITRMLEGNDITDINVIGSSLNVKDNTSTSRQETRH